MVDSGTWIRLSAEEQSEYSRLSSVFIQAVNSSKAAGGRQFRDDYSVVGKAGMFFLAKAGVSEQFAGITSSRRAVMEALLTVQCRTMGGDGRGSRRGFPWEHCVSRSGEF